MATTEYVILVNASEVDDESDRRGWVEVARASGATPQAAIRAATRQARRRAVRDLRGRTGEVVEAADAEGGHGREGFVVMSSNRTIGLAATAGFIATVFVANWLVAHYGVVPVGFGLLAPAGVYAVGVAFTLRDAIHRTLGVPWVIAAITAGAGLSVIVSAKFALASGAAFLASEIADLVVYTPLRRRSWIGAVALSNTVGLAVDSALFLALAFGSLQFFWGQVVGKAWMTVAAIVLLAAARSGRGLLAGNAQA